MSGDEWVQDPKTQIWHLTWMIAGEDAEEGAIYTWCHLELRWDDPARSAQQLSPFEDIQHDECFRKASE